MSAGLTPEGAEKYGLEDATEEEIAAAVEQEMAAVMTRLANHFENEDDCGGMTSGEANTAISWITSAHPLEALYGLDRLLDLLGIEEVAR